MIHPRMATPLATNPPRLFARIAGHSLGHAHSYLAATALVTVVLGAGMTRLELRTDGQALRPTDAEVVKLTDRDQARFHDPRQAIVLVSARDGGPAVATPPGLRFLADVHRELRAVHGVRGDAIVSLASVPNPVGDADGFSLTTQLESVPGDARGVADLVARLELLPWIEGLLLSADGRHAALYVPLIESGTVGERVAALQAWAEGHAAAPFEVLLTGPEVAESALGTMVLRDLLVLVPVMLVVIALVLWATLRTVGGVVVPLLESLLVLVWTFGAMGWAGVPVTLVSTILPVVLMAMAITDEIHLLERVQVHVAERGADAASPRELIHDAVYRSYAEIDRAVLAAAVTTALGFLSFLGATLPPMRDFGASASFGILAAMVLTFAWVPAMMTKLPLSWVLPPPGRRRRAGEAGSTRVTRHPIVAAAAGCVALAAAVPGVLRLRVQDSWVENFAPDTALVRADHAMNAALWGTYRFDVVLDADRGFFFRPEGMRLLRQVEEATDGAPNTGGSLSIRTLYKEIARSIGISEQGNADASALSADAVADVAALADMSGNRFLARQLVTEDGAAARLRLFVREADYVRAGELRDFLDARLPAIATAAGARWSYSGDLPVALAVVGAIVGDQMRSIFWSTLTITAFLAFFFTGVRGALIATVPVIGGIAAVFGAMGYAGWPLGIASSMFASLGVGVGVDFGVHVLHRYQTQRDLGSDHACALEETFATAGRALWWNMLVLALGLSVLVLSQVRPNHSLGILLAGAMAACYAATMLLLPALLRFVRPKAVVVGVMVLLFAAPAARADDPAAVTPCSAPVSIGATEWMGRVENDLRSRPRAVRTEIETSYEEGHPLAGEDVSAASRKTLWAAFDGESAPSRMLYVFSSPGRLAGTSLLIHDHSDTAVPDRKWLYLRSFAHFTELTAGSERVVVPGTPLTYDDARGFLPGDRYEFRSPTAIPGPDAKAAAPTTPYGGAPTALPPAKSTGTASPAGAGPSATEASAPRILVFFACPRTTAFSEATGYGFLEVALDTEHRLVRRLAYHDLSGRVFKTYEASEEIEKDGAWWPASVRLRQLDEHHSAQMRSEYWTSSGSLGPKFFAPVTGEETFLERFQSLLRSFGASDRLAAEIAESESVIRRHDEAAAQRAE